MDNTNTVSLVRCLTNPVLPSLGVWSMAPNRHSLYVKDMDTLSLKLLLSLLLLLLRWRSVAGAEGLLDGADEREQSGFGNYRVGIVLPAYNEEKRLPVEKCIEYVKSRDEVALLIVNDGSTDRTRELVMDMINRLPRKGQIQLLDLKKNGGKAEAIRVGMLEAARLGSKITGFWDADLATPLEAIDEFLRAFEENSELEMVFGARVALLGRKIERHMERHYLGRIFATLASMILRLRIYDTQCGAKLFKVTPDFIQVLSEPFGSKWIFDVEILARFLSIRRANPKGSAQVEDIVYELPLREWRDIGGSKVSFLDKVQALQGLAHIYSRYFAPWSESWPPPGSAKVGNDEL